MLTRVCFQTIAAILLLTSLSQAAPETFTLSASTSTTTSQLNAIPGEPEAEWNCIDIIVGGKHLKVIMPRFIMPVGDHTDEILELARLLVSETILASSGDIGTQYDAGTIFGVEYKVFTDDPNPAPAPPLRLAITGTLESDTSQPLGTMYCYDAGQYGGRVISLGMTEENIVWPGSLGHGDTLGNKAISVLGTDNVMASAMRANGSFGVTGSGHVFLGDMLYGTTITISSGPHTLGPQIQLGAAGTEGLPHTAAWYLANYDYFFVGDVSILNNGSGGMITDGSVQVSGLIYATGSISIDGNDIDATASFVAEEGIYFIGNDCNLLPAVDELLAYSTSTTAGQGVSVLSSNTTLTGSLVAPAVMVSVGGSANEVFGQLQGDTVRIMGKQNSLSNIYRP